MKRKILAILLVCLMIVSVLPISAVAADHQHKCPGADKKHTLENCPDAVELEVVPSVCGEYGYTLYQCPECSDYFAAKFVKADGNHSWEVLAGDEAVAVTCTTDGKTAKETCSKCGKTQGGEVITSQGHKYEETGRDGDCLTGGFLYEKCTVCGDEKKTALTGTGVGHKWSANPTEIKKTPAWNEEGIAVYECEKCHITKEVTILSEHNHKLVAHPLVPATCTTDGNIAYWECSICGKLFFAVTAAASEEIVDASTVVIAATGHDTSDGAVVISEDPAICGNPGSKIVECKNCHEKITVAIPAPGHTYSNTPIKINPTCTAYGFDVYACTVCGYVLKTNPVNPLGHTDFDDPTSTNKSSTPCDCENDGVQDWTCGRCPITLHKVLTKTGHTTVTVEVPANCSRFAYTFEYCTNTGCTKAAVSTYEKGGIQYDVTVKGNPVHLISCEVGNTYDLTKHSVKSGTICSRLLR